MYHSAQSLEIDTILVTESVFWLNKTTSMPKSVLHYDVDKDLTSVWNSVFTQSCYQNKSALSTNMDI